MSPAEAQKEAKSEAAWGTQIGRTWCIFSERSSPWKTASDFARQMEILLGKMMIFASKIVF